MTTARLARQAVTALRDRPGGLRQAPPVHTGIRKLIAALPFHLAALQWPRVAARMASVPLSRDMREQRKPYLKGSYVYQLTHAGSGLAGIAASSPGWLLAGNPGRRPVAPSSSCRTRGR